MSYEIHNRTTLKSQISQQGLMEQLATMNLHQKVTFSSDKFPLDDSHKTNSNFTWHYQYYIQVIFPVWTPSLTQRYLWGKTLVHTSTTHKRPFTHVI